MIDSEALARLLQDEDSVRSLSQLRREIQLTIEDLKRNKDLLEAKVSEKLKKISAQRAELDQLERDVLQEMLQEDKDYQAFAGWNLQQAISAPNTMVQSVARTENNLGSDADIDTDSFDEQKS